MIGSGFPTSHSRLKSKGLIFRPRPSGWYHLCP